MQYPKYKIVIELRKYIGENKNEFMESGTFTTEKQVEAMTVYAELKKFMVEHPLVNS